MKFCNCSLAGNKACEKCATGNGAGASSEYYYAQFSQDVLKGECINRLELEETEFEKFVRLLIEEEQDELD